MAEVGTEDGADLTLAAYGLAKRYRRATWALRDVSIELRRGTMAALVGPNGAGKTTLLRIWVGFEQATRGTVEVLGADPWRQRDSAVAHIGYIASTPRSMAV